MRCAHCASPLPSGGEFCTNCGTDVREVAPAPSSLDNAGVAKLTRMLREQTAGDYEIERELARGGMGVVYVATETELRRRVAIKVLPPALTFGATAIERFRREARTAAALDHANIIPIYRVSSGGELLWYSMKLLEGRSLDSLLKERGGLDLDETVAILDQVAEALDYAHQHGVIHRDVKPGNIFLDDRGRVTVTDFGIAKEIQEPSVSASGHLLGTPHYMSPEHYRGAEISGAADQYSLGVVAFQCLGGRVPFDASTAYELLNKHASEPPPPLAELRPDLPLHSYAAIDRALAKKPEDRFATVAEFVSTLAGRIPAAAAPRRSRRGTWLAGITATGIALYGVVTVVRGAREQSRPPPDDALRIAASPTAGRDSIQRESAPRIRTGPTTQAPMAVLVIRLTNGWARIYVDGALRGERPVHREELPPGTHSLRFERPDFVALDTTLTLQAGVNVLEIEMRRITP